jgi:cytochrome c553
MARKTWLAIALAAALGPGVAGADAELDDELSVALEATPDLKRGRVTFNVCGTCHTPEGWGSPDGHYPQIAGQHRSVLIKQLADIRAGNRDNPEMRPFARRNVVGGPQGIADVTGYIADLPMNPNVDPGPGGNLERGEEIFKRECTRCHGDNAEGSDIDLFPSLYGQHYEYLLRQLRWIQEGKRRNVYRGMVRRVRRLSDEDLQAVADYVSRIKPPPDKVAPEGWLNTDLRGPAPTDRGKR